MTTLKNRIVILSNSASQMKNENKFSFSFKGASYNFKRQPYTYGERK